MQPTDLQEIALRLSAVVDFLEERAERASLQSVQGVQALSRAADGFDARARQLSEDAVEAIVAQSREAVQQGVAHATSECHARLQEAAQLATRAAAMLDGQTHALGKVQHGLAWKAGLALLVGAVLAAGGSALVAWKSLSELERVDFGEDIVRATRDGSLTRCGEGLCARVGPNPRRGGERGEYVLIQP
jgi:hypothetical protein